MQKKDSWKFPRCTAEARGMRHSCTWKGTYITQESCWDEISFGSVQYLLYVFLCTVYCFENLPTYTKNLTILPRKKKKERKKLISNSIWYPLGNYSIHNVALGVSTLLHRSSLTKPHFQRVWFWTLRLLIWAERRGSLYQKNLFLFLGEGRNSGIHRSPGFCTKSVLLTVL